MTDHDHPQGPGQGPLDRPIRDGGDPIGDDAYPGGSGMPPPTADMDDPIPETGMPGEPELTPTSWPATLTAGPGRRGRRPGCLIASRDRMRYPSAHDDRR